MRMFYCVVILIGGCAAMVRNDPRVAPVRHDERPAAQNAVAQTGGRDVLNVSPTLAVSGGGGVVLFAVLGIIANGWLKSRRTLRTMVAAIEGLDVGSRKIKQRISRHALTCGVADYLHQIVKKG